MRRRSLIALLLCGLSGLAGCSLGDDQSRPPQLGASSGDEEAAAKLGFPSTATKNTIRVGGGDPAADAAGVANAVYPSTGRSTRPTATVLVDAADWQGAVAGAVLAANPIGAPVLLSEDGDLPPVTKDTLETLDPSGSDLAEDAEVIRIGDAPPRPDGFKSAIIEGDDVYERAAAIDRFFSSARGRPSADVIVASGEEAAYAMPAAAWAARSGDSVLLTEKAQLPKATSDAIEQHQKPRIFVLGPKSVISEQVETALGKLGRVQRIEGETAVENAVAFARYERGDFGWGINEPGYNFTIASTSRPADAGAAAALATRGVFAPLLLTDDADELPKPLESFLLSVQPGYEEDPGDAVYNRIWILGDDEEVSVKTQARLDQISELIPVQPGNAP